MLKPEEIVQEGFRVFIEKMTMIKEELQKAAAPK